jgi:hypothetical protein
LRHLPGAILGGPSRRALLLCALSAASGSGQRMIGMPDAAIHGKGEGSRSRGARQARRLGAAKDDPWWTAQLLKLGEDALAFERIGQMPTRGKGLVQWAHDLVSAVRSGDLDAREELVIVLQILSDQQDRPKPQKQPRGPRKPTLAGIAKQASKAALEVARYEARPDGTVVVVTGKSESTEPNPWLDDLKVTKQ